MARRGSRGWVIGGLLVVALAIASASTLLFQGRDDGDDATPRAPTTTVVHRSTTTTSTTTSTSTPTTAPPTTTPPTTTAAPPPTPAPAPLPVELTPPPPAPAPSACDGAGSPVIDAMNADRAANGVGPLCGNGALASYAQVWANWMAQHQALTHQDLNGILGGTTFNVIGENILSGDGGMPTADMESAWMASPGHRQNILNGAYAAAGVGVAFSGDGRVWVAVDFGG